MADRSVSTGGRQEPDMLLVWGCFVALVATAFGFIVRALIIGDLQAAFDLTETQKGEILGVGLWPFAISIVLFSLVIDRIGYGKAMAFAFGCHIVSAIMTIFATNYQMLYWGTFIVALGNGTVEAVINPVVATMFTRGKVKWLNILHAGWPGGMVLGGLIVLVLMPSLSWQAKVGLIFLPTIAYAVMLFGRKFPVHERVAAGVSDRAMLQEVGFLGALIITGLMVWEFTRVLADAGIIFNSFEGNTLFAVRSVITLVVAGAFGAFVGSIGRPLFIVLLLIMIPLATTELGTDSWIGDLMTPAMQEMGIANGGWVLIYTAFVMMLLRFGAGQIVERLQPLGLLAFSALIAIVGLLFLSKAAGVVILVAATIYACGKAFFWPTMLGVVAEQFPKGGAMTMNTIAAVGMLSVGTLGAPLLGYVQDSAIESRMAAYDQANQTSYTQEFVTLDKVSIIGAYRALDQTALTAAPTETQTIVHEIVTPVKKETLAKVAILPGIMLLSYIALIIYFQTRGGYKVQHIEAH
jgi:MFS family permease